jgi:voltage-gated potassium channel
MSASLWFSITSTLTIGYGDYAPSSAMGRAFTILLIVGGLALIFTIANFVRELFTEKAQGIGK